jgi:hypothetical protein
MKRRRVILCGVLAGAVCAWAQDSTMSGDSLSAAQPLGSKASGVSSLAVADLEAQGVKESDAAVVAEQLRFELMKDSRIRMIERSQMEAILKEQGFQETGCTNEACGVEMGQLLGVRNMVIGSVGAAGSYTVLSVRVLDVRTGQVAVSSSQRTKGGIDQVLESGIGAAAGDLIKGLFADTSTSAPKSAGKRRALRNAFLFGGGAAVLLGGGITAAILLSKDEPATESTDPNTRIELP